MKTKTPKCKHPKDQIRRVDPDGPACCYSTCVDPYDLGTGCREGAHGGVTYVEECGVCRKQRQVNSASSIERGPWQTPDADGFLRVWGDT